MRINKHDTQGTKPLLGKGELGYDDYAAGGDTGRVYVGTGTENIALAERLESNMMTKAQFNALAEERKANRAGSGFDEWGKHINNGTSIVNVNEGIFTVNNAANANTFYLGDSVGIGVSKTVNPITNINGTRQSIAYINNAGNSSNKIILPTAPNIYPYDTVLTTEQINSGVIKHADSSNSGLIVNGKFDTDTSGWSASGSGTTFTWENGVGKLTTTSNFWYASQTLNTIVGKKYIVECAILSGGGNAWVVAKSSTDATLGSKIGVTNGIISFEFIATTVTTKIWLYNNTPATSTFDNIAVYPADAISRSDLVFLESWHEDISEKNFVYPLGNVQYLGSNTDGLTGIANGAFTGFETYSLFGNWQTPSGLIGKGYVWSSLTEAQRKAFIANPDNNCYLDGVKVIQVRYRVRVAQGLGDSWSSPLNSQSWVGYSNVVNTWIKAKGKQVATGEYLTSNTSEGGFVGGVTTTKDVLSLSGDYGLYGASNNGSLATQCAYEGKCFALPLALVHRRNQGMWHHVYNPNGTKLASDGLDSYRTAVSFTSISDCFNPAKLLTTSGYIDTVSGRPDGLFYDQVHESDILDLRNDSKKVEDYNRLINREFNKLITGTNRGKEGEKFTEIKTQTTTGTVATVEVNDGTKYKSGDVVYIYDLTASTVKGRFVVKSISSNTLTVDTTFAKLANSYLISGGSTSRNKSNTMLICDVIGNPANYPTEWKNIETPFITLHTAEDGTSLLPDGVRDTFKLSRKANATPLLCLRSTDNGATWTSFTPTFSIITNEITLTDEPAGNLVMVYYQTHTSMAVPVVNSEVIEIGGVWGNVNYVYPQLASSLCGKILAGDGAVGKVVAWSTKLSEYNISGNTKKFSAAPNFSAAPSHPLSTLPLTGTLGIKVFPYLTRTNGKAYLNLVFKEMKHNGTSWGDDSKFNIVDYVSTTTDTNAATVLIGQKTVELNVFIGADE